MMFLAKDYQAVRRPKGQEKRLKKVAKVVDGLQPPM
jgi:hypothetical protein